MSDELRDNPGDIPEAIKGFVCFGVVGACRFVLVYLGYEVVDLLRAVALEVDPLVDRAELFVDVPEVRLPAFPY